MSNTSGIPHLSFNLPGAEIIGGRGAVGTFRRSVLAASSVVNTLRG